MCSKKRNELITTNEFNMEEYFRTLQEKQKKEKDLDESIIRETTSLELPN